MQLNNDRCTFVRRRPGERYCVSQRVKHPTQVMIWSIISSKGIGNLYFVDGTMNSQLYLQELRNELRPQLRRWHRKTEGFQCIHDGAPCHRAHAIKKYLYCWTGYLAIELFRTLIVFQTLI